MSFGQLVIGPPGSGKTTYCLGMSQFLKAIKRDVVVVNLDPANDVALPYECTIDIADLIRLQDVMEDTRLGPNGGLVYCMEYLEKNIDWLQEKLKLHEGKYLLFDCPGQVELYTHHGSFRRIVDLLQKWRYRLTAVNLIDSYYCTDPALYISALLLSLSTMIQLELPHVNVLSKIDAIERYGKLAFNLDFYTDVMKLKYLQQYLPKGWFATKFRKLNKAMCGLVEDYNLVQFLPLDIQNKESVWEVLKAVDKCNGYVYGGLSAGNDSIFGVAASEQSWEYDRVMAYQEKYISDNKPETTTTTTTVKKEEDDGPIEWDL